MCYTFLNMKDRTIIFTDGAAKGNPGRGGFGVVISHNGTITEKGGFKEYTTNNEMELKAVVEALKEIAPKKVPIDIYTDSKYVVEGAKGWVFGWAHNGWVTKAKTDVLNKELWQELLPLLRKVEITWHKIPGHSGLAGNERADVIASTFAEKGTFDLYEGVVASYSHDIHNTSYDEGKAQDRSDARKRQSQKAYSYISALDGVVLIHSTWAECEARVKGKKGARFKKSLDKAEEGEIVREFGGGA
jgi:ribonuclease HI